MCGAKHPWGLGRDSLSLTVPDKKTRFTAS